MSFNEALVICGCTAGVLIMTMGNMTYIRLFFFLNAYVICSMKHWNLSVDLQQEYPYIKVFRE
jgi:hypothetical protein